MYKRVLLSSSRYQANPTFGFALPLGNPLLFPFPEVLSGTRNWRIDYSSPGSRSSSAWRWRAP